VKDRYRSIVDVYVILLRADGRILLLERANTGYADGQLCPPSGHLEHGESVIAAAAREAHEEVGVRIAQNDLTFSHVVHHRNGAKQGRIGLFFTATRWGGEPANQEPNKCAGLLWADPANPPASTVPYTAAALAHITTGTPVRARRLVTSRQRHLSVLSDAGPPTPSRSGACAQTCPTALP
jgi:8-oxo-dGTP pyrophosphatase MutT (NUDIX family)